MNCSKTCPKGLNPGKAVAQIKKKVSKYSIFYYYYYYIPRIGIYSYHIRFHSHTYRSHRHINADINTMKGRETNERAYIFAITTSSSTFCRFSFYN